MYYATAHYNVNNYNIYTYNITDILYWSHILWITLYVKYFKLRF